MRWMIRNRSVSQRQKMEKFSARTSLSLLLTSVLLYSVAHAFQPLRTRVVPTTRSPPATFYLSASNSTDEVSPNGRGAPFPRLNGEENPSVSVNPSSRSNSATTTSETPTKETTETSSSTTLESSVLAIDPTAVDIVTLSTAPNNQNATTTAKARDPLELLRHLPFVSMFRGSANYIANHRNTLAVYHIPGGLTDLPDPTVFRDLMNDVALTWLLGMKIVLVVGCRYQLEKRLLEQGKPSKVRPAGGLRVTDRETLRTVKEEAGFVRFEVERELARALRVQGTTTSTSSGASASGEMYYTGNVVSGNFYSAQPMGILDGVDYQYTGFVRRVEVEKIRRLLEGRDICLMTTLGVSPSGQVFNVNSECLAATVAGALQASKVIYFTELDMELRHKVFGNKIPHLRMTDARNLLDHFGLSIHQKGFSTASGKIEEMEPAPVDMLHRIGWSVQAIQQGVKRAHIISPKFGALLQELYTRDGSGTMVSGDLYDGIRRANLADVNGIYDLIAPLIAMGTLVDRPKEQLEVEIDTYYVYTRDNLIVACGQLKQFENGFAEIGCMVVSKEYRSRGRGDAMLCYLERMCVMNGCTTIFVLSTQTMEWFVERGFEQVRVDRLPPSRQKTYNYNRMSKIYMKKIESMRDLDASELWWNR